MPFPSHHPFGRWAALIGTTFILLTGAHAVAAEATNDPPFIIRKNIMMPMRDGVELAAHIFLPRTNGPFPVLLMRTPYGKPDERNGDVRRYTAAGYAVVVQDCRGRGDSKGVWEPFQDDPKDGFDTQEWVGNQPWCNGKIGTYGGSYVGWTQWASAPLANRHLKTMVPVVPFGDVYHDIAYQGGAFQLSLLMGWGAAVAGIPVAPDKLNESFRHLPLQHWPEQFGRHVPYIDAWVRHTTYDDFWRQRGISNRFDKITIPILNIGGWYDIFSKTTIDLVDQVREHSTNRLARRNQFVIMGPWGHGIGGRKLGELDYGGSARLDLGHIQLRWFNYWLKDAENDVKDWPAYRLFVMGENQWRGENEWPLARTRFTSYYLHSQGKANTRHGDGSLSTVPPGAEPPDTYEYNPQYPVPTRGGNNLVGPPSGAFDQREIEDRRDVLVYSTPPLDAPVEVTGPVRLVLHALSSATDTDFTAKLVDVHPDGRAYNLCDGIVRARFRRPNQPPELIEPGQVHRYEIDLWVTSNLFLAGHRIRLEVSSSNFPRFDRNPNTGRTFGADADMSRATQSVFHDADHEAHLILPIIPR